MSGKRTKHLILFLSALFSLLIAASPMCHADNFPDISTLDRSYFLNNNRQFFTKDSGYMLVSTDSVKETMVTMLNSSGKPDKYANVIVTSVPFAYEKATLTDHYLYLAGKAPDRDGCVKIARLRIADCILAQNQIENVSCDFTRGFYVKEDGSFFLVTVPYGTEIEPFSPFWKYVFDGEHAGAHCGGQPATDSDLSSDTSSDEVSSSPSSEPEPSSGSSGTESGSTDTRALVFNETVTVETLQKQLDSEGQGATVRVTAADGTARKSGNVGTGSTVEVILNGQVESRVTVVIPGDLTGSGEVTERDSVLMYEHITNQKQLAGLFFQAADINGDEKIDTSDMLRIKKLMK